MENGPKYIIGVDIGATKIAAGLVDGSTGLIMTSVRDITPREGNDSIQECAGDLVERILNETDEKIEGIGIGIPGFVDRDKGIALTAGNLNMQNMYITDYIYERFGIPVRLENDTNAGTLGEKWFGCGRGLNHYVYMAIGTGIGGGLVINGQLYLGKGNAGEIGHMIANPGGELCVCGIPGCLETIASGTAIARRALELLKAGGLSSMRGNIDMERIITAEGVVHAANAGDSLALQVMEEIGRYLANNLISIARLLDPEAIIIGGGVSEAKGLLLRVILQATPTDGWKNYLKDILRFSPWTSGIVGAASVYLERA